MKRFALVLICAATVALGTAAKDDRGMGTLAGTVVGRNVNRDGFSFPI